MRASLNWLQKIAQTSGTSEQAAVGPSAGASERPPAGQAHTGLANPAAALSPRLVLCQILVRSMLMRLTEPQNRRHLPEC